MGTSNQQSAFLQGEVCLRPAFPIFEQVTCLRMPLTNSPEGALTKTMNESLMKRCHSDFSKALFAFVIIIIALSAFPVHKVQADPSPLNGTYMIREISRAFNGAAPNGGWGSGDDLTIDQGVVFINPDGWLSA
jgi:hypothetical protein